MISKNRIRAYAASLAAVAAAVVIRWIVDPWLHDFMPLVTLYGAVAIAVWLAGYRAASVAAIAGYFVIDYLFVTPRHTMTLFHTQDLVGMGVYATSCAIIIAIGETMRRERRRAQVASEQVRIVADTMSVGVTRCSRDLRYLWVNQSYCEWIKRPAHELVGRFIVDIVGAEAFANLTPYFERVLSGETVHYEKEVQFKDVPPSFISATYTPTRDENGAVDGWVAVVADISDRKSAERQQAQLTEVIRNEFDALTRLHAVATLCASRESSLDECVNAILDTAIAFTRADRGNIQLLDARDNTLRLAAHRGFKEPFLKFFDRVDGSDVSVCGRAMRERRRVIVEDVAQSELFAEQTSREALLDAGVSAVQSTPLVTSRGVLIGMISTHYSRVRAFDANDLRWMDVLARQAADYLERSAAEEALKESEEALREADRRKDEFLAVLSHELRNPLAPIGYAVEILKKGEPLTPQMQKAREVIQRQVRLLSRLIDDLMDVSRITRGTIGLRRQHVELRSIVNDAVESSRPLIEQAGHTLRVELPAEPVIVHADAARLSQVLMNLLNNAAKYTERGGRIDVLAAVEGETLVIRVRDTGVGTPPQMLGRVFEMFAQEDRSLERSRGGLGIGLSLARRLVAMHDGELEAHSDGPGHGSEFIVRLPVAQTQHDATEMPVTPSETGHPLRVLVVDDNEDAAESMSMFLTMLGHEVQTANDGLAAVEIAATFQPAAVLLDLGLPVLNGFDAAQRIRAQRGDDVVLVAVTGWGQEEDRKRSRAAGFDYHLTKPVSVDEVKRLLSAARMPAPKA